ncbi:MAG: ABC transporter permease [Gammaproteobacteria bacterium SG8_15]|nr:MAG: ABC transporter permease [Gammaproteobacteria bacterium SG8_15]
MYRKSYVLIALLTLAPIAILTAVMVGSVSLSSQDVFQSLLGNQTTPSAQIIQELRLPRAIGAFSCGALLALAGVLMQVLLRNPLADPYVLGISGGAAVATLLAMLAGVSGWWLTGSAFAGSLLSMFIVFGLAQGRGSWSPTRLLLTGIVVAAGWGACVSFILALAPARNLHSMLFWLMGDLSYVKTVWPGVIVMLLGLGMALLAARRLNVLLHGSQQANALGIDVSKLRLMIYLLASLMTATAVTIAGSIGFVGLIVPHLVRLSGITDHRWLLPGSALLGGSLLVIADTFARTVMAPQQLPVGVIMAMIGVPLFLFLLHRNNRPL